MQQKHFATFSIFGLQKTYDKQDTITIIFYCILGGLFMFTEKECRGFVYRENGSNRHTDGNGLFLQVLKNGTKYWGLRLNNKKIVTTKHIGEYPYMSLSEARVEAIKLKAELENPHANSRKFRDIVQEWLECKEYKITEKNYQIAKSRIETYILPYIGHLQVKSITALVILKTIREIEKTGKFETARRVFRLIAQILDFAVSIDELDNNITNNIAKLCFTPHDVKHMDAITDEEQLGKLLRELDLLDNDIVRNAIQFQAYTLVRPNEARKAEWQDINLKKRLWIIRAEKMKMKQDHIVPLSRQAYSILQVMINLTGNGKSNFVFPQVRNFKKPMTENTAVNTLKEITSNLGLPRHTAHGFRATASTLLNKHGFKSDVIEWALAHTPKNNVRTCYNRHNYLEERNEMLQWYADFLDELRINLAFCKGENNGTEKRSNGTNKFI